MQLSEFRDALQERLADTSTGFYTTAFLNNNINHAIRETARLARCYERTTSMSSISGVQVYRVPTDYVEAKAVSFINGSVEYWLSYLDIRDARASFNPTTTSNIPSVFSIWQHERSHQRLWLFPKPDTTWTPILSPGAPTLAQASGGSLDASGVYGYRVTFYNQFGETDGGTTASITLTPPNQSVSLSAIPTTTDTNVVGRRIYRTEGGASIYYYLTTLADRATTTTYADTTADTNLGPEIVSENTANNVRLYYYSIPSTALSADTDTPAIPTPDYDEAVIAFVMMRASERNGDLQSAQLYRAFWKDEIADIKGDQTTKHRAHFVNVWDNSISAGAGLGRRNFQTPIPSTNANS